MPQATPSQKPPTGPTRQTSTPRTPPPSIRVPSSQNNDVTITKDSHNYDNHGIDNRGGTINDSIVAGGDVNNKYNR